MNKDYLFDTKLEVRFNNALKAIRKQGVKARRNVSGCCGSCIAAEGTHKEGEPIIWHFGGQGHAFGFKSSDGLPYYQSDLNDSWRYRRADAIESVYFNHDGLSANDLPNDFGCKVLSIFADHGITVHWDGNQYQSIEIDFKASVYERPALDVMNTDMGVLV